MIVAICDDEQVFIDILFDKTQEYISANKLTNISVRTYTSETSLMTELSSIDILFLDIEMDDSESGIRIKNLICELNNDIRIIFVTSHFEMVEDAFGKNVLGFLKKSDIDSKFDYYMSLALRGLLDDILKIEDYNGLVQKINPTKVKYVKVSGKYTDVLYGDETFVFRMSLNEWERILPKDRFCMSDRSTLVNFDHIEGSVLKWDLKIAGKPLNVIRSRKKHFKEMYKIYLRGRA